MHHFLSILHFAVGLQFWKNLAGKCILEFGKFVCLFVVLFHIVLDLNSDIIVCLFIISFKVHEMPYYGTFNTTSWIDIFRQIVYIVLIAVYWPLCFGYEGPNLTSISLYIILSCVECFGDSCAYPYIYGSNQSQTLLNYDAMCLIIGYLTTKYMFGYFSLNAFILTVFHQYCHLSLVLPVCKQLEHAIKEAYLSLRSYIVLRHRFLKKYGKRKVCCYFLIFVLKICTTLMLPIGIIKTNEQISVMYREYGWQQTIDFSNESLFDYRITSMNNYSHPLLYRFEKCIQNTCSSAISYKTEESYLRICDMKKAILNEHVLLSVKDINWDRNSLYVWTFNDIPISEIRDSRYIELIKRPEFYLIIRNVNTYDFGTYTLFKHTCSNLSYSKNSSLNRLHEHVNVIEAIACTDLVEQDSKLVVYASLGEIIKMTNISVVIDKYHSGLYIDSFMFQIDKCMCGAMSDLVFKTGYSWETKHISEQWSVIKLQMSFCVCPILYKRNYIFSQWVADIPMHFKILFEPRPIDLFKPDFFDEFIVCERKGYNLETFYKCIDRHSMLYTTMLQKKIKKQFDRIQQYEFVAVLGIYLTITFMFCNLFSCLDKLLFYVFHREFKNIIKNMQCIIAVPPLEDFDFDIYLSYNDEFSNDKCFAEDKIKQFLITSKGYHVLDCENIKPGQHRRSAFEENIIRSKVLIILLSAEYLENEICMQLEYEYTLLSLIGASKLSRDNVLVIKMDTCPLDARPLTQFNVLDWSDSVNNLRTESEKEEKLHEWLVQRLRKPGKLKIFLISWVLCPILRMIGLDLQPGNIERQ